MSNVTLQREQILTRIAKLCVQNSDIEFAYLFGSTTQTRVSPISDIDVAVWVSGGTRQRFNWNYRMALLGKLIDTLQFSDVDLVFLNEAPILLRYEVLKKGTLIYCNNDENRIRFFQKTVKEKCDTEWLREANIMAAKQRIKEGIRRGSPASFTDALERVRRLFDKTS